jgi:hypothetical protein
MDRIRAAEADLAAGDVIGLGEMSEGMAARRLRERRGD